MPRSITFPTPYPPEAPEAPAFSHCFNSKKRGELRVLSSSSSTMYGVCSINRPMGSSRTWICRLMGCSARPSSPLLWECWAPRTISSATSCSMYVTHPPPYPPLSSLILPYPSLSSYFPPLFPDTFPNTFVLFFFFFFFFFFFSQAIDSNRNGEIDFHEFLQFLLIVSVGTKEEKLHFGFSLIDLDKNGEITRVCFPSHHPCPCPCLTAPLSSSPAFSALLD